MRGVIGEELQERQQILIMRIMSKIVGYMVTWRTYGSWLPGDERGYVQDGEILAGDVRKSKRSKQRQKSTAVRLTKRERQIVHRVILGEAEKLGHEIEACVVFSNHVHVVSRPHGESIEEVVGRYKSATTRALWEHGRKGRIWAKGYDKRFCFTEEELAQRIRYVNRHNLD